VVQLCPHLCNPIILTNRYVIHLGELLYKSRHYAATTGHHQQSSKTHTRITMATSKLFQPIQVGTVTLQHRVVMAPLTRYRGNSKHTPTDLAVEHYAARGSVPGTLLISEATFIAPKASGKSFHAPGIWSDEQVVSWKKVWSFLLLQDMQFLTRVYVQR
jgi:NADH:flavin oxidoreductase / NADH oxidase family